MSCTSRRRTCVLLMKYEDSPSRCSTRFTEISAYCDHWPAALPRLLSKNSSTLARGVATRVYVDENRVAPVFLFASIDRAHEFAITLPNNFDAIRAEAESTTRHGKLQRIECHALGREVIVNFCYFTGDAHGMNMIVKATDHACQWIMDHCDALRFYIFSGFSSEKRASGSLLAGGKGKQV